MQQLIILLLLTLVHTKVHSQTITFTDLELKRFLINESCANTNSTPTWQGQFEVDMNNDNEIQISEALAIKYLKITDISNSYSIQSLNDLVHFSNLVFLEIGVPVNFDRIQLDSLKSFYAIDVFGITKIDISNLPNLTDEIRIEGTTTLDTLNIQNGSKANLFSLFYTQNIKYACVDSIASEYNAFGIFGAMLSGRSPSINCSILNTKNKIDRVPEIDIFPNPTNGIVEIKTDSDIDELSIISIVGKTIFTTKSPHNSIDISSLTSGIYFFKILTNKKYTIKKVILH